MPAYAFSDTMSFLSPATFFPPFSLTDGSQRATESKEDDLVADLHCVRLVCSWAEKRARICPAYALRDALSQPLGLKGPCEITESQGADAMIFQSPTAFPPPPFLTRGRLAASNRKKETPLQCSLICLFFAVCSRYFGSLGPSASGRARARRRRSRG